MAGLVGSVGAQSRIVWYISNRILELKTRESPIGIFSSLIEPLSNILIMTVVFSSIRLKVPAAGDYIMLFFMTGILPISLFRSGATSAEQGYSRLRKTLVLPQLRPLDLMIGGNFVNSMVMITLFISMTLFFIIVYNVPWPQNFVGSLIAPVCNACMGLGVGAINLTIKSWFPFWGTIWSTITAPLGICSGMFYTASTMPTAIREILYYNPLMHSTELTRTYYFEEFTSDFFDPYYYFGWVLSCIFLGLLCERVFRYRLLQMKR